ncbi:HlyD family efflux transporter periplasmic adaptor subunit [Roseococcus sp. SYP-B2431]|uniref:HlyD family efflux transporter periplasmic adaptor subunit n=1 Tax=Roseococcus sp. SYP-B2431 TaxID=2496640 RepID=UPI00103F6461|nr:HlyD family efflux transporter periplasmic adaptor subunit [Roseococcus sp. SYP-B2431]TCH99599.1 HlyD family efflux transporter periplasmic adaptor subunit [Roseococcus sp. SYP-B2431]
MTHPGSFAAGVTAAPAFDDLARLAAILCEAPIGYVALLDSTQQWILGAQGMPSSALDCPREHAFCGETLANDNLTEIEDLSRHPRFRDHPLVQGEQALRFYAGMPVRSGAGEVLGTLCVLDRVPRRLREAQRDGLARLAARVTAELELRRQGAELHAATAKLAASEEAMRGMGEAMAADYGRALDSMADGVLTIGPGAGIMTVNPAAARMLDLDPQEAVGRSLAAMLHEREGTDEFIDAVLAPLHGESGQRRTVSFPGGRRLSVEATVWRVRQGPEAGRPAITAVFSDVTETERLQAEIAEQYAKLQDAFLKLEESAVRAARTGRRLALMRTGAIGLACLAVFGVAAWTWQSSGNGPGFPQELPAGVLTMTAAAQPVSARIAIVGVLEPGANVSVIAPFDGTVRERLFRYGGAVTRGDVLLRLDRGEVETRLREARAAEIRARQKVDELRSWAQGFEVARARRTLAGAELETSNLRARVGQSAMLLGRGIIPAEEHRNLLQQQRNQELQLQAAQQDLAATLARGDELNLRTAELELANAETKLQEVETDLRNAEVTAPVSGVVLAPPEQPGGGQRAPTIETGSRVSRGQAMFSLGDLAGFLVRGQVDEIDVNSVRPGQAVTVTGDAFAGEVLNGRVASVAAQASTDQGGGGRGMPSFAVSIAIAELSEAQRARLAVGMSASLSIITHQREDAVVLPPQAVRDEEGARVVRVREGARIVSRPVTLGISTPEGVEIRTGVQPGEVVVLRE